MPTASTYEPIVCPECGMVREPRVAEFNGKVVFGGYSDCPCVVAERLELKAAEERRERRRKAEKAGIPLRFMEVEPLPLHDSHDGWYVFGNPGTGKTHRACQHALWELERGRRVLFTTTLDMVSRIKSTYGTSESTEAEISRYLKPDLVVLDDLGKEKPSEWIVEQMYRIIDGRYNRCKKTLVTSNYTRPQLVERYSAGGLETAEAIVSRLVMLDSVDMRGKDRRL